MTTDRTRFTLDFDRLAAAWLADGPAELSDRTLEAALAEVRATRQRRGSIPRWRATMTWARVAVASVGALVVVVSVVGFSLLGSPAPTPSALPTTAASAPDASPPAPSSTAAQPPSGRIAFIGGDPGGLRVINADGSNERLLIEGSALTDPRWSPDGTRLALTVGDTTNHVVIVDANGSNMRTLVHVSFRTGATWAPDGQQLAFADLDHGHLYVINADGTGLRQLTSGGPSGTGDSAPAWSPTGDLIAFLNDAWPFTVRPDGSDRRQDLLAFDGSRRYTRPAWSPDGSAIAATTGGVIWVVDSNRGVAAQLAPVSGADQVTWSPDGEWLAFLGGGELCPLTCPGRSLQPAPYDIYLMRRDGTGLQKLTNMIPHTAAELPSWAPAP